MAEDDVACLLANDPLLELERTDDTGDVNILDISQSQGVSTNTSNYDVENILSHTTEERPQTDNEHNDVANILTTQEAATATTSTSTSTRSSGRARRRSRHRRHQRRRPQFPGLKGKETNFIAAICSMIVMVAVCTALVEPQWFMVYGGGCRDGDGNPVSYIGMNEFLRVGHFQHVHSGQPAHTKYIYQYGSEKHQMLYDCVMPDTVDIIYCILAFCFIIIALSLVAFLLDLAGPSNRILVELRRNAVFNVLAVLFCVLVNGFCYWVTEHLYYLQDITKSHASSRVEVQFSISFYLMAAAGAMSVLAAACNLLKTNTHHFEPRDVASEESNELDMGFDGPATAFMPPPPPPPYSP